MNIAVLDDDKFSVFYFSKMMSQVGVKVQELKPSEGLSQLDANCDVLLLDYFIPESWVEFRTEMIQKCKELGIKILYWTVSKPLVEKHSGEFLIVEKGMSIPKELQELIALEHA